MRILNKEKKKNYKLDGFDKEVIELAKYVIKEVKCFKKMIKDIKHGYEGHLDAIDQIICNIKEKADIIYLTEDVIEKRFKNIIFDENILNEVIYTIKDAICEYKGYKSYYEISSKFLVKEVDNYIRQLYDQTDEQCNNDGYLYGWIPSWKTEY